MLSTSDSPRASRRIQLALWSCALLTLFKLWLTRGQGMVMLGEAGLDDALVVKLANHILHGRWLGPYDETTLAKGPFYSIWLAALHLCRVPLKMGDHLAYIGACLLAVCALRPKIPSIGARSAIYLLLLWNPMTWEMHTLGRVMRQGINTPLALCVMACAIAVCLRPGRNLRQVIPWAAVGGFSLGCFWLTREEGLWLIPSLLLLTCLHLWLAWRQGLRQGLGNAGISLSVFLLTAALPVLTVCKLNESYYGWFGTVEFKAAAFKDAYGALTRVQSPHLYPFVHVTREARELTYPHSKSFTELKPMLEGGEGRLWAGISAQVTHLDREELQIAGGWFMWVLRDTVVKAGHGHDARSALAFYQSVADEVNSACDTGLLASGPRRSGFLPPLSGEQLRKIPGTMLEFADFLASFRGFDAFPAPSDGRPEQLQLFRRTTLEYGAPTLASGHFQEQRDEPRTQMLHKIGKLLRWPLYALSILGLLALATRILLALIERRPGTLLVINLSLLGACLALILVDALVHISSFPVLATAYLAAAYPLLLLFDALALADLVDVWRRMSGLLHPYYRKKYETLHPTESRP